MPPSRPGLNLRMPVRSADSGSPSESPLTTPDAGHRAPPRSRSNSPGLPGIPAAFSHRRGDAAVSALTRGAARGSASPPGSPASATAGPQRTPASRLPRFESSEVGGIVHENAYSVAPRHVPLVTSNLVTCRALAISVGDAHYLGHIFEWPSHEGAHTTESMSALLDGAAGALGMAPGQLANCRVAVVSGSEPCDEIDGPLHQALRGLGVTAEWHDAHGTEGGVHAVVHEGRVQIGHDAMTETAAAEKRSGRL